MEFITHIVSGSLIVFVLESLWPATFEKTLFALFFAIFFASVMDVDALFAKTLSRHHTSPLHKPIFWIGLGLIAYSLTYGQGLFPAQYVTLALACVFFHFFTDTVTARTTGVAWLYPFSTKEFSLFKLTPSHGNFKVTRFKDGLWKAYRKSYYSNVPLVVFEQFILVLGVVSFFV